MSRGRPRKFDPSIPAHIDQKKLPKGAYWDGRDRVWYTRLGRERRNIAPRTATLADLHARLEQLNTGDRGSLGFALDQFHASPQFAALAAATRRDYNWCRDVLRGYRTGAGPLAQLPVARLSPAAFQAVVDRLAGEGTPSKANHVLRYVRRALAWAVQRGLCAANPARGVEQAAEVKAFKMPAQAPLQAVLEFARDRGARKAHTEGSLPGYLAPLIEIAYRCRLRGIEACSLVESQLDDVGIVTRRRKGSKDNHVEWSPELRAAVEAARAHRSRIWAARDRDVGVITLRSGDQPLFVSQDGTAITKSGLDSAWDRLMDAAIAEQVITPEQRFTPHGLKHRGITDTKGGLAAKQEGGGHVSQAMTHRYNHELPLVKPAGS